MCRKNEKSWGILNAVVVFDVLFLEKTVLAHAWTFGPAATTRWRAGVWRRLKGCKKVTATDEPKKSGHGGAPVLYTASVVAAWIVLSPSV
jgi:hypothetical protein